MHETALINVFEIVSVKLLFAICAFNNVGIFEVTLTTTDFDGIKFRVLLIMLVVKMFKFVETAFITVVGAGLSWRVLFARDT